jgi:hypothetical protein
MNIRRINWLLWSGFLLALVAGFSYLWIFLRIEATRNFPAPTLLLYLIAVVMLVVGVKRAFAKGQPIWSKIIAVLVGLFGVLMAGLFVFSFFVFGRMIPASKGAPHVGQKAPEFTLSDSNNKQVTLSELLAAPLNGKPAKGVVLVFYRGYW